MPKKNISLPEDMVEFVDNNKINLSKFVQDKLKELKDSDEFSEEESKEIAQKLEKLATIPYYNSKPKSLSELRKFALNKKNGETIYGYFFLRRISPFFTWLFIHAGVSPNTVTLLALFSALTGSLAFLSDSLIFWIFGYVLYQLYYVLDCSDGEVAIVTDNTSDFGAFMDKIGHPITNSAIIYFSAFGAYRITGSFPLLIVSASGAIMFNLTHIMRYFIEDKPKEIANIYGEDRNQEKITDSWFENKDLSVRVIAEEESNFKKISKVVKNLSTTPGNFTHPLAFLLLIDFITGESWRILYPTAASLAGIFLVLKRFRGVKDNMS